MAVAAGWRGFTTDSLNFLNLGIYFANVFVASLQIHLCDGQSRLRVRKFTLPLPNNFAVGYPLTIRYKLLFS
jgi:hypothetical protein